MGLFVATCICENLELLQPLNQDGDIVGGIPPQGSGRDDADEQQQASDTQTHAETSNNSKKAMTRQRSRRLHIIASRTSPSGA